MKSLGELTELATPGLYPRVVTMINPATGRTFGLVQHDLGEDVEFFRVSCRTRSPLSRRTSRDELEEWVEHLDGCGVPHSAISEMPYGSVVVFSDPDNIQLELMAVASNFQLDLD